MEGFRTFTQAVDEAARYASCWRGVSDQTVFSYRDMMGMAFVLDSEAPLETPFWYAVLPTGEIGLLSPENKRVDQLFLALNTVPVPEADLLGFGAEETLPDDLIADGSVPAAPLFASQTPADAPAAAGAAASAQKRNFCPYCGEPASADFRFCRACGRKL